MTYDEHPAESDRHETPTPEPAPVSQVRDNHGVMVETLEGSLSIDMAENAHISGVGQVVIRTVLDRFIAAQMLAPATVQRMVAGYVEREITQVDQPDHVMDLATAITQVKDSSYVVLLGKPGTGLRTAAVAFLDGLLPQRPLHAIPDVADDFNPDKIVAEAEAGYLLRLEEAPGNAELATLVEGFANRLRRDGSRLVVTATPDGWVALGGHHHPGVLRVRPPAPAAVLRQRCPAEAAALLHTPEIAGLVAQATTSDAVRLAGIAAEVVAAEPHATAADWAEEIGAAYHDWTAVLADWFRQHPDVRERHFAVAAAMLEGLPAPVILDAAHHLGRELGEIPIEHREGLGCAGLRELTKQVEAEEAASGLRFPRAEYAESIVAFVRKDRSAAVWPQLWGWAARYAGNPSGDLQRAFASRLADLTVRMSMRHRDHSLVTHLHHWAKIPSLRPYLVDAVTALAASEEVGRHVRQRLYEWSQDGDVARRTVVAAVCRDDFATLYPRVSLTRLGHIADRADDQFSAEVRSAVASMWRQPALRPTVLSRLTTWCASQAPRARTGRLALADLAGADLLHMISGPGPWRQELVESLATPFAGIVTPEGGAALIWALLEAGHVSQEDTAVVAELLAEVVSQPGAGARRAARMCALAFHWRPDDRTPAVAATRDVVHRALHRADPLNTGGIS
ncbi:hypothetical protein [Pilimelia columellifera]|uniref:Uncharacterized protein n=1 Tax=Pilimelia columellifera subsp. columellifera TaxID=706583 RepID=A0ABN3NN87_9ACTN